MKFNAIKLSVVLAFAACTPTRSLHDGDQFHIPYIALKKPEIENLRSNAQERPVKVQKCLDRPRLDRAMPGLKPLFDILIKEALGISNATLLKDVSITVKNVSFTELEEVTRQCYILEGRALFLSDKSMLHN